MQKFELQSLEKTHVLRDSMLFACFLLPCQTSDLLLQTMFDCSIKKGFYLVQRKTYC
jgi:hypothetical protein